MNLQAELVGAVERSEITVFYQPQIDVVTDAVVAVEALSRWAHPTHGILPPGTFIHEAERTELIHEIGDFMLDAGCHDAAAWRDGGFDVEVAINVSALQLATSEFFERLMRNLSELSLGPHSITVEITESQAIGDISDAARRLSEIREIGVDISIDDFGTGHSSVSQVMNLPATEIKLDRSLVQGERRLTQQTMSSIVELAHDRGLRVVAEGVETTEQFDRIRDLGCDRCQGYLIGRPVPGAAIEGVLRRFR